MKNQMANLNKIRAQATAYAKHKMLNVLVDDKEIFCDKQIFFVTNNVETDRVSIKDALLAQVGHCQGNVSGCQWFPVLATIRSVFHHYD